MRRRSPDMFGQISRSCARAVMVARDVWIDSDGLRAFASSLDSGAVRATMANSSSISDNADTIAYFNSVSDHVNYCILFSLMQFGHGFRHALHASMGMGASKAMTAGVNSIALSGKVSSHRLAMFSDADVDVHFRFPRGKELDLFRAQVKFVLSGTGKALENLGYLDFNALVMRALGISSSHHDPLDRLLRRLECLIPAFHDTGVASDGKAVYFFKKAQLAICELHRTVGATEQRFRFPGINRLRAVVDNVIPAMLVKHGVLRVSDRLESIIKSREYLPRGVMETELRAASVVACERIVECTGNTFTNVELSTYLWLLGKLGENRQWERHHTIDTIFY